MNLLTLLLDVFQLCFYLDKKTGYWYDNVSYPRDTSKCESNNVHYRCKINKILSGYFCSSYSVPQKGFWSFQKAALSTKHVAAQTAEGAL